MTDWQDTIDNLAEELRERLGAAETSVSELNERLDYLTNRLDEAISKLDNQIDRAEERVKSDLGYDIRSLESKVDSLRSDLGNVKRGW